MKTLPRPRPGGSGAAAEDAAATLLARRGLRIVARNVRFRCGELDLIARDGATLVFIEVRRRASAQAAAASIDAAKRGRIRRAARLYLARRHGDRWPECRFDVVLVDPAGLTWLRSAFDGIEE